MTFENEEGVIGVIVLVADELTLDLHEHEVVVVELSK